MPRFAAPAPRFEPALRALTSPATAFGVAAALLGAMLLYDADVLAALGKLDATHHDWHLGDVVATLAVLGLAALMLVLRRGIDLRREMLRGHRAAAGARLAAEHDALTGLPNRQMFLDAVEATLARPEARPGVMLVGLDGFARFNDLHGRAMGDLLLYAAGDRLRCALPAGAMLARFGGDEFAVLFPASASPEAVLRIGNRALVGLAAPFACGAEAVTLGASIGIALAPGNGAETGTLVHQAGLAMDRAKLEGPGLCRLATPLGEAVPVPLGLVPVLRAA
jgi:diguanylate cyclase (GGDEF)-like protein